MSMKLPGWKKTLEKTEGAIKNGQSRDIGNIVTQDTVQRRAKQKKQSRKLNR